MDLVAVCPLCQMRDVDILLDMILLSIETSCDDTGISILECTGGQKKPTFRVLADTSNSQINIHRPHGGVFPMLAKREHIKNLPVLLERALHQAKLHAKKRPVSAIAVTYGPGLEPALWTGITFAQELAEKWGVPVIPVNHMEGHIVSVFGKDKGRFTMPGVYAASSKSKKGITTPILSLLVSGGHTQLVLSKRWMHYEIIGETRDDAVGEAFDKVARMLGLPYPGGPEISKLAERARVGESRSLRERSFAQAGEPSIANFQQKIMGAESSQKSGLSLPRPMLHTKDFNFSFSGLKTAVLYLIKKIGNLNYGTKAQIAMEFENAAIECLVHKTMKAVDKYSINTLIVSGGVSCNTHLKNEMTKAAKDKKIKLYFPTPHLATDNSLMIGIAGYLQYLKKKGKLGHAKNIKATGNLRL